MPLAPTCLDLKCFGTTLSDPPSLSIDFLCGLERQRGETLEWILAAQLVRPLSTSSLKLSASLGMTHAVYCWLHTVLVVNVIVHTACVVELCAYKGQLG